MSITLKNIQMRFNDTTAVNNLNLTINSGELVSLLGPSGCGKSTTLFMMAGLYEPTQGQIFFNDVDVTKLPPEKRNIGMVFQNYALYPHMSVLKNIAFPLKMNKINKKEMKERAIAAAKLVEIDHLLDRKPGQLSGGQQQRVAIARAIVREPEVLLLDEPLSNLDARLRLTMREEIRELQQRLKITTLFVTHDQEEALSISDKIVLMKDGELMQYGTPSEMYDNPQNKFVAEFIGSPPINFINHFTPEALLQFSPNMTGIRDAVIGIRPEDINVGTHGYPVTVKLVEKIGKDILVTAEDQYQQRFKLFVNKHFECRSGDIINISTDHKDIRCFDANGKRVIEQVVR